MKLAILRKYVGMLFWGNQVSRSNLGARVPESAVSSCEGGWRATGESVLRNRPVLINEEQGISPLQTRSIIGGREQAADSSGDLLRGEEGRSAKPREWRRTDAINSSVSLYHAAVLIKKKKDEREKKVSTKRCERQRRDFQIAALII